VKNIFNKDGYVTFNKDLIKQKDLPDKLLLVMAYLRLYCARNGTISTSINIISKKIGYKPNYREGKINDQIIKCINWLLEREYLTINDNVSDILNNDCFEILLSDSFNCDSNFVVLNETEFDYITLSKIQRRNKEDLIKVYLNIKKYMSFSKDNIQLCYPSHSTLCRDCNISSKGAMNNIIADLVNIGLLYTYNPGRFIDNKGNVKYANNLYALEDGILLPNICDEIMLNYYFTQGITINEFIKEDI